MTMRNLKWQNYALAVIGIYTITFFTVGIIPHKEEPLIVKAPTAPSEIGMREDRQSRTEYEREMLVVPGTNQVPYNIKKDELAFAKKQYQDQVLRRAKRSANGTDATQTLDWQQIGPENFGGRTRALALDVRNENIMLAGGVSGGMWRSTNLGENWTKTTTSDQLQSVTCIVQNKRPGSEDIWYYGTGELIGNSARGFAGGAPFRGDGIYRSTDNGQTWSPILGTVTDSPEAFISPFQYVWDIETDPSDTENEVILAAVVGGIVRSEDGGATWSTVLGDDLFVFNNNTDLNNLDYPFATDIHRTADNVFYATLSSVTASPSIFSAANGIYRSDDGIEWEQIRGFGNSFINRIEIGSSASDPNFVYFIADRGPRYGFFAYDALSGDFDDRSLNIPSDPDGEIEGFDSQGSYNLVITVHPDNPDVVYVGGTNLYRSTDGFRTNQNIAWIGGYNPEDREDLYPNHHPDQHEVLFTPSNNNRMITANDGGVFITDNNLAEEVEHRSLNNGFITTQFFTTAISQYPPDDLVFGGTQDNGSLGVANRPLFQDNGTRVIGGDGGFAATTPFGFYYYMSFQNSVIFRLTLNENLRLTSFARVDPTGGGSDPSQSYLFVNPYILDKNNANRMYLAGGDVVWRNRNLSQLSAGTQETTSTNWDRLDRTEISEGRVSAVEVSTSPKNVLYFGTSFGQLFKVTDAHTPSYQVTNITRANLPELAYIRSISVDPRDADRLLVSFANYEVPSIFLSTDGGDTFQDVSGNLEENIDGTGNGPSVRWVTIVPQTDGTNFYMAGTSTGLYTTEELNGTNTLWTLESPNGIGNSVVNMIDFRRVDGKVAVGTHGKGIFTAEIPNVEPLDRGIEGSDFAITSVAPNPFSEFVSLTVTVPENRFSRVRIYDSSGELVRQITGSAAFEGENEFFWDGTDAAGQPVPNGIYIFRITYGGTSLAEKVILQRN